MLIEGAFTVAAPRDKVWPMIRDTELMAACLPGCEEAREEDDGRYRVAVKVKVGPIAARFLLQIEILEEEAPLSLHCRTRGEEGSRASQLTADSLVRLEEGAAGETEVTYRSDVQVTGRLGKFGLGLMRKKADQLAAGFVEAFRRRAEAEAVS